MYRSSSSTAQDWGSVDDSEVEKLLETLGSKKATESNDRDGMIVENSSVDSPEVPTDKDDEDIGSIVDVPSSQIEHEDRAHKSPDIINMSKDIENQTVTSSDPISESWHSMSNAQFIAYVNKLGSERSQALNSSRSGYEFHLSSSEPPVPTLKDQTSDNPPSKQDQNSGVAEEPFLPTQKDLQLPSQSSVQLNINSSPQKVDNEDSVFPVLSSPSHEPSSPFLSNSVKQTSSSSFGFNTLDEQEVLQELEEEKVQRKGEQIDQNISQQVSKPVQENIMRYGRATRAVRTSSILKNVEKMPSPPEEQPILEKELEFGDYATYFHNKQLKQQQQDEDFVCFAQKAQNKVYPPIFKGCVIYVNGKTSPDIAQLHKMIILHGGKFLAYLGAKGNATHIIAEVLTPRKRIEFRNYKVVRPAWILESIEAGKILPWSNYMLINNDYGQKRLNFWAAGGKKALKIQSKQDVDGKDDIDNTTGANAEDELEFQISQIPEYTDPEQVSENNGQQEDEMVEKDVKHSHKYGQLTAKDPNFLENFFAKSRLHHLSTWKTDLRTKFLQKAIQVLKKRRNKPDLLPQNAPKVVIHVDFLQRYLH